MSSLSSNLKQWGASGSEYPDGYNYLEGEQPVDEWDNFVTYNLIEEVHALQSVVNDRMESDVTGSGSHPSSPEVGHVSHRTDTSNLPTSDEATYVHDGTNNVWHRLMQADGDTMTGVLDMGGYKIHDATGTLTLGGNVETGNNFTVGGSLTVTNDTSLQQGATLQGGAHDTDWFQNHDGGVVAAGNYVPLGTCQLADGETFYVQQASLTQDGFNTAAATGITLVVHTSDGTTTTVLNGDGSSVYNDQTGNPLASYSNSTGGTVSLTIGIDNGHFTTGNGSDKQAFAGYIAYKA